MTATKIELRQMVDRYEADPNSEETCDLLCSVCDALPGQPDGEYSVDEIRQMIDESELD